ncbi:MAG TPA: ATP-binding cassette domain-containing protein [Polyangiaceae bacterium]|nr:ATP-binding cassette domain-containing protein [Polyangiaceae bacterium]
MKGAPDALAAALWPPSQLGEALYALAHAAGLRPRAVAPPRAGAAALGEPAALDDWVQQAASYLGVEAEPMGAAYNDVLAMLRGVAPAIVCLPAENGFAGALALVGPAGADVRVLRPDGGLARVPARAIADLLRRVMEARVRPEVERTLERTGVDERRRDAVRRALLREWLGPLMTENVWTLRPTPGAPAWHQAAGAGLPRRALAVVAAQLGTSALLGGAWWTIAEGVLDGRFDRGRALGWALLVLTSVPVGLFGAWSAGLFALDAGALLKRRLLAGALALAPEEVRNEGAGSFLGRVLESSAVESLALGAGLAGVSSAVSFAIACGLLARGAGGWPHVALLLAWAAVSALLVARYYRRRRRWTDTRLALTNDLVERMGGHRTRLAQEFRERWHDGEDQAVSRYVAHGEALDQSTADVTALLPRGWTLVGVLGLVPSFVDGAAPAESFALSLGGVLLAGAALQGMVGALANLAAATIAWRRVAPLFHAAAREGASPPPRPPEASPAPAAAPLVASPEPAPAPLAASPELAPAPLATSPEAVPALLSASPEPAAAPLVASAEPAPASPAAAGELAQAAGKPSPDGEAAGPQGHGRRLLEAREVVFRHHERGLPVLRGVSLRVAPGDRMLLEGPSGGGKSTLSAVLAGLRQPESGLLLLGGLDQRSLGTAAWRRRVVTTPQFHENHVLQNTFAFNLLMGRRWPPSQDDLAEAEGVCRALGLGELLGRMPGGLQQMVGETGWQLSHGEKSRLYIARSLLQGADLLLFDESFGALDPETLGVALRSVLERAPTLLVIAHP